MRTFAEFMESRSVDQFIDHLRDLAQRASKQGLDWDVDEHKGMPAMMASYQSDYDAQSDDRGWYGSNNDPDAPDPLGLDKYYEEANKLAQEGQRIAASLGMAVAKPQVETDEAKGLIYIVFPLSKDMQ